MSGDDKVSVMPLIVGHAFRGASGDAHRSSTRRSEEKKGGDLKSPYVLEAHRRRSRKNASKVPLEARGERTIFSVD
jgi:hypothetical protein